MIGAAQNLVRSLCSCAMRVVPSRGINHFRGKCGQHLAATSVRLNPAHLARLLVYLTLCLICMPASASSAMRNVLDYGATGDGITDDTVAVNKAIAALQPGDTLLFPCTTASTYLITSQLTVNVTNVTVDGSSCAVIHNTASGGTIFVIGGSGNGNPNYGPAIALSATANELARSFMTVSSLGVAAGDYVRLQQGGRDSSTGSTDTQCDVSACRGEVLKVASVSGNTITVTTKLHDTYDPSVNLATAQKILSPLTGVIVENITFDGSGSNVYGLALAGVAESKVSGVTSKNVQGAALLNRGDFNVAWSNVTVSRAGSAQCGSAAWFENQGNLRVGGMSIFNENPGAPYTGCLDNGAFGFELVGSANAIISNLTRAFGRPFKTAAARWNTFNSLTVKNGVSYNNGISVEYYSSHNTYRHCKVTDNGAGTGTGTGNAGINLFGNFNQYNIFADCTVTGNGNVQFFDSYYDALGLGTDSNNAVVGGTYAGTTTEEAVIILEAPYDSVSGATISGPGSSGIEMDGPNGSAPGATNACINNNDFVAGTGLTDGILAAFSSDIGSGNELNGLSSNLTPGTCSGRLIKGPNHEHQDELGFEAQGKVK